MKRSLLSWRYAVFAFMLTFLCKPAVSRDVEATYAFCLTTGSAAMVCPLYFSNPEEPFLLYQAWIPIGSSGYVKVSRLHPDPNGGTTNGLPTRYSSDMWYDPLDWKIQENPGIIFRNSFCPLKNFPYIVYTEGVPSNIITARCVGYSEPQPDPGCEKCQPSSGNPIYPSTGVKFQREADYAGSGSNELEFVRIYRSDRGGWTHNYQTYGVDFTAMNPVTSVPCYFDLQQFTNRPSCFRYRTNGMKNDFMVQRSGQRALNFGNDADLSPPPDINDRVTRFSGGDLPSGFKVQNAADDSVETYDTTGRLLAITSRNGKIKSFSYSDSATPLSIATSAGLLIRVTDAYGHELNFTYDAANRMTTMTDSAGGITVYGYDENTSFVMAGGYSPGNLTSVTYPGGGKRLYWYNEQDNTSGVNLPFALTGISDELGVRFATYKYDTAGRAISTEHAGGVEKFTVDFPSLWSRSTVTDPLGTVRNYTFQTIQGSSKSTGVTQPGPGGVGTVSSAISYDANGNVARSTSFDGSVTTFGYNLARNLETVKVEAYGTQLARTISTDWHPVFRLPTKIAEPQRLTTFTYDTSGNLLTRTVQSTLDMNGILGTGASAAGAPRTVRFTYDSLGKLLTATGPRSDVPSSTNYIYDAQGNLSTIVDAVGHLTKFQNYDSNGRAGRIITPNGITTDLFYTPRGWLNQRSVSSGGITETTDYEYDSAGQIKIVTLPDHSTIHYDYDNAHRLTGITDSIGNKLNYTYDLASNRILEQVSDPSSVLTGKVTRVYDALNLLKQQTGGTQ